jgi:hypothetical protein
MSAATKGVRSIAPQFRFDPDVHVRVVFTMAWNCAMGMGGALRTDEALQHRAFAYFHAGVIVCTRQRGWGADWVMEDFHEFAGAAALRRAPRDWRAP